MFADKKNKRTKLFYLSVSIRANPRQNLQLLPNLTTRAVRVRKRSVGDLNAVFYKIIPPRRNADFADKKNNTTKLFTYPWLSAQIRG